MTLVSARTAPRVLLASEDPLEAHLLRSLLRALPDPRPELITAEAGSAAWSAALAHCDICFLSFAGGERPLAVTLAQIAAIAPGLRVVGVLGAQDRFGDRAEIVQALRAGLGEIVLLEELSLAALRELITPRRPGLAAPGGSNGPRLAGAAESPRAAPPPTDALPIGTASTGSWRITLSEQRAAFDAPTLERLGHAPGTVGNTLGDWKALIHPEDIDRLVAEVHGVLNGSAPPHPIGYRLRTANGEWIAVVSDDIAVELDDRGSPRAISGHFYETAARPAATAVPHGEALAPPAPPVGGDADGLAERLATAVTRLRRDASGVFRVVWSNAAAGALEQREPELLHGLRPAEFTPPFDGFDLEDALARVHQTGIAEAREAMALGRGEQPHWRSYRITRLDDGDVLLEATDISEHVGLRVTRRMQDEMAQYIVRALPLSALLVDEHGRVVQSVSVAGGTLGTDPRVLEDRMLGELLGANAGAECRLQIQKTLNTGRIASAVYAIETPEGRQWLACHSAAVRGRPGMPQRALLTLQDVSESVRDLNEARLARDQLRVAIRRIPVPLFLKDTDGRYVAINPAFGELYGVEESMLLGKTDLEVFPDELAMELHEADRRVGAGAPLIELRVAGQGERRGEHFWFGFAVGEPGQPPTGSGCLLVALDTLPLPARPEAPPSPAGDEQAPPGDRIDDATASVVGRVEQVLVEAGDYADVLRRLEQLAETTMHAQALIHEVAGKAEASASAPLTALTPLAQNIVDLERVLLPASARLENEFAAGLPLAHCDPLVFHQVLLRGIRHARRGLAGDGTLAIRLRAVNSARRACVSCREGFEGQHVELVIEDSGAMLGEQDFRALTHNHSADAPAAGALDDLAGIHALVHSQGGHLQIQQSLPAGNSLHVYFRAASSERNGEREGALRSTVTRFPFVRLRDPRNPS